MKDGPRKGDAVVAWFNDSEGYFVGWIGTDGRVSGPKGMTAPDHVLVIARKEDLDLLVASEMDSKGLPAFLPPGEYGARQRSTLEKNKAKAREKAASVDGMRFRA